MPITGLSLTLDRPFYVRVDPAYATIRAFVTPTAGSNDSVEVTLAHARAYGCSGGETLATQTVTVGTSMVEVTFNLATMLSPEGFPLATRSKEMGDYTVTATVVASPLVTVTQRCTVLLLAPEAVKSRWLLGLSLTQAEKKMVRVQPSLVTGTRVVDVGTKAALGPGLLAYVQAGPSLAWRGGTAVVVPGGIASLILVAAGNPNDYLVVEVDSTLLPAADVAETLVVDQATMTEEDIGRSILDTVDEVERRLYVPLEPRRVVSRMLIKHGLVTGCFDKAVDGHSWYAQEPGRWINVALPFLSLLRLDHLSGWINDQKTLQVDPGWMQISEKIGHVSLIPGTSVTLQWLAETPLWPAMWYTMRHVPGWWQFDLTHGLREIPTGLLEYIGKSVGVDLLTLAGMARNPSGVAGASLSRDGVSESKSMNPMGIYASTVNRYLDDLGQGTPGRGTSLDQWRELLVGIPITVL